MALWGDIQVTRFIGGPFSEKEVQERLAREFVFMKEHGVQYWPVFLLGEGDFTGCCGLRPYRLEDGIYEPGIPLSTDALGQGICWGSIAGCNRARFQVAGCARVVRGPLPGKSFFQQGTGEIGIPVHT